MDILCFGSADFEDPNWVNAQHLMWRLSSRHRVLYVNSLGLRRPRACRRDLRKIGRRIWGLARGVRQVASDRQLFVLAPVSLPPSRVRGLNAVGARLLAAQLRRSLRHLGFGRPVAWTFLPTTQPLLTDLEVGPIIYHCVDAYAANPGVDRPLIESLERGLLRQATAVIASSEPLHRALSARHERVLLMPNVVDLEAYPPPHAPPPEPPDLAPLGRPRIGYVGNLAAYKCDIPLLAAAAAARPAWSWIFVGGIGHGEARSGISELAALPNVYLLGEKPRLELAGYVHHMDVGLVPFVASETTRHSFPMKFFEYLACGKPVVTAQLASLEPLIEPPLIFAYGGSREFLVAVDQALDATAGEIVRRRRALAEAHSWSRRMVEIEALLAEL
jgi:glycosyltransferase involved in cell wall biosynthesis